MVHYDSWPDAERINHISPEMVKNATFHNEGHHPHIHMVAYSTGAEGYLTKYGVDDIKSTFAKEIFKLNLEQIYKQETKHRNDLRQMAKAYIQYDWLYAIQDVIPE